MSDSDPSLTLDYYLANPNNHSIKADLEDLGCSDILEFFHRFYRWIDYVKEGRPSEAIKEIEASFQPGGVTVLIIYHLRERFRKFSLPSFGSTGEAEAKAPEGSLMYLDSEYERWKAAYPPDIYAHDDPSDVSRIARERLWGHYHTIKFLDDMVTKMLKEGEEKRAVELQTRQSERELMQTQIEDIVQKALAATGVKKNPEFTLNRQVLALGYMLHALGVRNIDKSVQANFIEFLINKTNKDVYDALRELEDRLLHREGKDAEYVIARFKELGLDDLASKIEQDLKRKRGL